jgi:hypothetical protein
MKKCIKLGGTIVTIESEASYEQRKETQIELAEAILKLVEESLTGYTRDTFTYKIKESDELVYKNKAGIINMLVKLIRNSFWDWLNLDEDTNKYQYGGNKMLADIGEDDS